MTVRPRWTPVFAALCGALALAAVRLAGSSVAQALPTIYVNSTTDAPLSANDNPCQDGEPCSLRRAIRTAQLETTGAFVTACFDPAEVPGARECPAGKQPLRKTDPNYDAKLDRWVIRLTNPRPILMTARLTFVDFRRMLTWNGPQDNKIIIDAGGTGMSHAFAMESQNNILAGFEIRGDFDSAAVLVRPDILLDPARNNQIGPGVVFAHMPSGKGVRIAGQQAFNNKVFGIWCGISGDGTEVSPLEDDCIYLEEGTHGNVIGDVNNPNILAASNGSGLRIEDIVVSGREDPPTRDNEIRGNWLGLDAQGNQIDGLFTGVTIVRSSDNRIIENVISNKKGSGVRLAEAMSNTLILNNIIGGDPTGEACRGNLRYGVWIVSGPQSVRIEGNRIICNNNDGIFLQGANTRDVTITGNTITRHPGPPITLNLGANHGVQPPKLARATNALVTGTACPGCTVEVFSDEYRQAAHFEGTAMADQTGAFRFEPPSGLRAQFVTATATDGLSTSELSAAIMVTDFSTPTRRVPTSTRTPTVVGQPTTPTPATPTPQPVTHTPSPGATRTPGSRAFLPWAERP